MRLEDFDIKFLKGVGETRAGLLSKELEINNLHDLLHHFPTRYIDRSRFYAIAEIASDAVAVQVRGHFVSFRTEGEGSRKRLVGVFTDGRSMMEVVWFNKIKTIAEVLRPMQQYILFGKPNFFRNTWSMAHPEIDVYNPQKPPEGLRGIYPLTEILRKRGFTGRLMQQIMGAAIANRNFGLLQETLPASLMQRLNLMPLREALTQIHFPTSAPELQRARERLKFEELFYLELHILKYSRERSQRIPGHHFLRIGKAFNDFYAKHLPFQLTNAQKRVLTEIWNDMRSGLQMNRLLQGDVGSGKTIVAFFTLLLAIDNETQGALMAPTEILAGQHFEALQGWCEKLGLRVELLTGSIRGKRRKEILEGIADGRINILVGTHALIEEGVIFKKLGVVVIDEQHRFGVAQRAKMWSKGEKAPHVLVMTATPIPRTLAMTVYGDLQVSVIDELPPGRKPITTRLGYTERRQEINHLVRHELAAGRQVYFVYPLIKENEKLDLKSLEEGWQSVLDTFPEYRTAYVHGKMKPEEKDRQMALFVSGEARILVATTVIEVGVNVPNASVMVIENAERFGLSQLHQLRGRVGRGADQSYCILMTKYQISADTKKRLTIMTETTDGFLISEADLKMRGPGDMEGTQQSGIAFNLQIADLTRDGQILTLARDEANRVLDNQAAQPDAEWNLMQEELRHRFYNHIDWSQIS